MAPEVLCSEACEDASLAEQYKVWNEADAVYLEFPGGGKGLSISGRPVMESWEEPYMASLAKTSCAPGGRVLEVGFGLGISARYIDAYDAVDEHVIFEANDAVLGTAALWADSARRPTTVFGGFWQELVDDFETGSFGGILFDAFPLSDEGSADDAEAGPFFQHAARLLRPGGVFTFYFDAGNNWFECTQVFRRETIPKLLEVGFTSVHDDQVLCKPRDGCTYFWKDRFLVPQAVR